MRRRFLLLFALLLLLVIPVRIHPVGIPTFDFDRFVAILAEHLPIKEWWDGFIKNFHGGDFDGEEFRGLNKFDQLLNVNIWGSLEGLGPKKYKEMFNEILRDFQETFLSSDYYERFASDAIKEFFSQVIRKSYEKDVLSETVLRGNTYYRENPKIQAEIDKAVKHKKRIYEKLVGMSKEIELRGSVDQKDLDRFRALCEYIDQADKGEDDTFGFYVLQKAVNQFEQMVLIAALQNEEIMVNRGILELLRSLSELDIYRELEKLHDF